MAAETFGEALARLRSARGLSVRALGRLIFYTGAYVNIHEHGRPPSAEFAARADAALGAGGYLIGLADQPPGPALPDWDDDRAAAMLNSGRPDRATVDYLTQALAVHRRAEDLVGPQTVLLPVLGQLHTVERLRTAARGGLHDELLGLEAQHSQLLGWLHQDLGDRRAAAQWYARALERATEAGDANMVSSILSMRSNAAWGAGNPTRAVQLGEAARRVPGATPGVLALATQQAARGHAAAGDRVAAERALDEALDLSARATADPEREPPWVYFLDEQRALVQRAIAYRELGDHPRAVDLFRQALADLDPRYRRDRGQYLARLAVALVGAGEREEAIVVAAQARELAEATGSDRTLAELRRVDGGH